MIARFCMHLPSITKTLYIYIIWKCGVYLCNTDPYLAKITVFKLIYILKPFTKLVTYLRLYLNRDSHETNFLGLNSNTCNARIVYSPNVTPWHPNEWTIHWGQDKMATIFADDIFKCISLNEIFWILNKMSPELVSNGLIATNLAFV